jgi:tetratricopeptide (TPR) repeat protein
MTYKIFISAVSKEFHRTAPAYRVKFQSYRDLLTLYLRREFKGCQIVVQEELVQGDSDLLVSLEEEVRTCDFLVHLAGIASGAFPKEQELANLKARHPDFLHAYTGVREQLGEWASNSYTQWEWLLALHYGKKRFEFIGAEIALRNPEFTPDLSETASQKRHVERLKSVSHYEYCMSQSDFVTKSVRSLFKEQASKPIGQIDIETLPNKLAASLRLGSRKPADPHDPLRLDAYLSIIAENAKELGIDTPTALALIDQYTNQCKRELEERLSTQEIESHQELSELAFAQGDYDQAAVEARQWIEKRTKLLSSDPAKFDSIREDLFDAYQHWMDAALLLGNIEEVKKAVSDASRHIDREKEPIQWAEFHEPLFQMAKASGELDLADEILDAIIDIREEHQAQSQQLAQSLFAWAELLKDTRKYQGALDVIKRLLGNEFKETNNSNRIFQLDAIRMGFDISWEAQSLSIAKAYALEYLNIAEKCFSPSDMVMAYGFSNLAHLLLQSHHYSEAEYLYRAALSIKEASDGPNHQSVAGGLNNLANLFRDTNRHREAESLYRRALAIDEAHFGPDHPSVAGKLNNIALLFQQTEQYDEAESTYRRALAIDETTYGPDHPQVGIVLNNLALLLLETNRLSEAEPLIRRALAISEINLGLGHPNVARGLNNLALVLMGAKRHSEAEQLYRRALVIDEISYGKDHQIVATGLCNLADLLVKTNRNSEAESLLRRALAISKANYGPEHDISVAVRDDLTNLLNEIERGSESS